MSKYSIYHNEYLMQFRTNSTWSYFSNPDFFVLIGKKGRQSNVCYNVLWFFPWRIRRYDLCLSLPFSFWAPPWRGRREVHGSFSPFRQSSSLEQFFVHYEHNIKVIFWLAHFKTIEIERESSLIFDKSLFSILIGTRRTTRKASKSQKSVQMIMQKKNRIWRELKPVHDSPRLAQWNKPWNTFITSRLHMFFSHPLFFSGRVRGAAAFGLEMPHSFQHLWQFYWLHVKVRWSQIGNVITPPVPRSASP